MSNSREVHIAEPVPVGGTLALALQVLKGEEVPAHVVEHPVQNHPYALPVALGRKGLQVVVRAQAAVEL